jgi:hypothetical protein
MLNGLLDGNADAITGELKKVLGDADQLEAARKQFLDNPQLAEAMGVPMDVVGDKDKWAAAMAEGMDALTAAGEGEEEEPLQKQFGKFSRAA